MDSETIFTLGILIFVALIFFSIGVVQLKSKNPVTFYTGEKPHKPEEFSDVGEWNRHHGTMWIVYGVVVIITGLIGTFSSSPVLGTVMLGGGIVIPLPIMILYHTYLSKKYMK